MIATLSQANLRRPPATFGRADDAAASDDGGTSARLGLGQWYHCQAVPVHDSETRSATVMRPPPGSPWQLWVQRDRHWHAAVHFQVGA
jgi:hypothetical protein